MENKGNLLLIPRYMQKFTCTGSECEDTCCQGWRIDIDKNTYDKYKKVTDTTLGATIKKNIEINKESQSDSQYAHIKLQSDGSCGLLTENKLCSIQLALGESYLSTTCASYPRSIRLVDGVVETSGSLSCPEITRLALLNPDGIEFDEVEEQNNYSFSSETIIETRHHSLNKLPYYFWDLRIFTISLLQNRRYSVSDRLIILGMFYQKLQTLIDSNNVTIIPEIIQDFTHRINNEDYKDSLKKIPSDYNIQVELLQEVIYPHITKHSLSSKFLKHYRHFLEGLNYTKEAKTEEIIKRYKSSYSSTFEPFFNHHEYIFENYLVNYVFKELFPFCGFGSVFDEYVMLVVHFAMVKLYLISLAGYHKEKFDIQIVIDFIQSFGRTVEHDKVYLKSVFDLLQRNNYSSMAFMALLIKN